MLFSCNCVAQNSRPSLKSALGNVLLVKLAGFGQAERLGSLKQESPPFWKQGPRTQVICQNALVGVSAWITARREVHPVHSPLQNGLLQLGPWEAGFRAHVKSALALLHFHVNQWIGKLNLGGIMQPANWLQFKYSWIAAHSTVKG